MNNLALNIEDLSYAYKGDWTLMRKPFLNNINLKVREGEAFGFLGHNGAGKTTTIKCLLGLTKKTSGKIEIFGVDSDKADSRFNIGFVPEQPYFYDHIKVGELMEMFGALKGMSRAELKNEIPELLARVKIDHKSKAKLKNLSKGQVQRVAMAQAMLGSPKLYVLDEPFSGLDPSGRKEFANILSGLKKDGATIFVSSHILSDIEFLCDRVAIMVNGSLEDVYELSQLPDILPGHYSLKIKNYDQISDQLIAIASENKLIGKFLHLTFDDLQSAEKALNIAVQSDEAHVDEFRFIHGGLEELFITVLEGQGVKL